MTPSLDVKRKFIKSLKSKGFKVKTDTGWSPIKYCHKTIDYDVWQLTTTRHKLKCADTHIVFRSNVDNEVLDEVYVKDLVPGELISTIDGYDTVVSVNKLDFKSHMYDLELNDVNHRYYTSNILSHNSATTRAFILWYSLFNEDKVVAILANKLNLAQEQLQQLRDSYIALPYWMQPGVKQWNKRGIQFSHGTRVVCAATSPDGIRGMSINLLYLDEFAFVKTHIADEFIASVFPTISSGKTTKVIITSCVTKDTMVFTENGIKEVGDFINVTEQYGGYNVPEYKVLGMKDELNVGNLMHNEGHVPTKIIKSMYNELECSLEHKLWTCQNGEYKWVKSKDLNVGDFISIKYGMNKWGNDKIDFIDTSKDHKNSNRLGNIEYLTPDLAYLIGLYIAEGNATDLTSRANIHITCGDDISDTITKVGLRYYLKSDGLHYQIGSRSLVNLLIHLGFDLTRHAPDKVIPKRLMQLSKSCTSAMLQGIFDGDGWTTKGNYRVGIRLSSKRLIQQIKMLILNYGILSTYGEGISRPTELVNSESPYYFTEVTRYDMVKKFFDEIGFRFNRKQSVFESFDSPTRIGHKDDVVPYSRELLKQWKKDKSISYRELKLPNTHKSTKHISRDILLEFRNSVCEQYDITDSIFDHVDKNVIWVPITEITDSENDVYDFSLNDVDGDRWCHSVIYNGIIGHNTPNGMNHFFRMWEDGHYPDEDIDDDVDNGYVKSEIPWNAPGLNRDEAWARDEMKKIGEIRFNQEYKCIGYNETIVIRNIDSSNIEKIKIGELYDMYTEKRGKVHITGYQILTPDGFKSFDGISLNEFNSGTILHLSNGNTFSCANKHLLLTNMGWVEACDTLGHILTGIDVSVDGIETITDKCTYYDVLEVEGHVYYSSDIISHNCEFVGSVSTLIDHNFLKKLESKKPLRIPKLPEYIKIYELPRRSEEIETKNWEYVASLDSGYGVHQDYTVLHIFLVKSNITLHQVATIANNKLDIEEFCKKAFVILKKYHNPSLIIEQNGPGAVATNFFHRTVEYENMIHFDPKGRVMGLWASAKLKQKACILFKTYVQRKFMHLYDKDTINELHSFGRLTQEKWGGLGGNHDDHITAAYWIPYYLNSPYFYGNIVEVNLKAFEEDDVILKTQDQIDEERKNMQNMQDPHYHSNILDSSATHLPENDTDDDDNDGGDDDTTMGLMFRV